MPINHSAMLYNLPMIFLLCMHAANIYCHIVTQTKLFICTWTSCLKLFVNVAFTKGNITFYFFTFGKNVLWGDFCSDYFYADCLHFLHGMKEKCFENRSPCLYLCKTWEAWMPFAIFQLFVLSLLFLSVVFRLELLYFCSSSGCLHTQPDMKLQLWCFQIRAWTDVWNCHVELQGIQHE